MKTRSLPSLLTLSSFASFALVASACSAPWEQDVPSQPESVFPSQPAAPQSQPDPSMPSFSETTPASPSPPLPATCAPADMSSYAPTWTAPAALHQGACSPTQIEGYFTACLAETATPDTCSKWTAASGANGTCATCIAPGAAASVRGPVLWDAARTHYSIDLAACIARALGDVTATGCGAKYGAEVACRQDACASCFQTSDPTYDKFSVCESQAGKTECTKFDDWKTTCPNLQASAAARCFPTNQGATAKDAYLTVVPQFCGN